MSELMNEFINGGGYYYFYSAILQGFSALIGVLVVGVVFKLNSIDNLLNEEYDILRRSTSQKAGAKELTFFADRSLILDIALKKIKELRHKLKLEDKNSMNTGTVASYNIIKRIKLISEQRVEIRKGFRLPLVFSFVIILLSAICLMIKSNSHIMTIVLFLLSVLMIFLILIGLKIYYNFLYNYFISQKGFDLFDQKLSLIKEKENYSELEEVGKFINEYKRLNPNVEN